LENVEGLKEYVDANDNAATKTESTEEVKEEAKEDL